MEGIDKTIFHLNLKKKWFDMVASGEKKEEYRDLKPHWDSRFFGSYIKIKGELVHCRNVVICFRNGYQKDCRQMMVECVGLGVKSGKKEWGAEEGAQYHTIALGSIIKKNF